MIYTYTLQQIRPSFFLTDKIKNRCFDCRSAMKSVAKQKIDNIVWNKDFLTSDHCKKNNPSWFIHSEHFIAYDELTSVAQDETRIATKNHGKRWQVIQSAQCAIDIETYFVQLKKQIPQPCISRERKEEIHTFNLYFSFQYLEYF